jgi:O-methyltransferase involved in polyketide biosynthesis
MSDTTSPQNISDTARWVAWNRALESERPDAWFRDPMARRLAGERGERIAQGARAARVHGAHRTQRPKGALPRGQRVVSACPRSQESWLALSSAFT